MVFFLTGISFPFFTLLISKLYPFFGSDHQYGLKKREEAEAEAAAAAEEPAAGSLTRPKKAVPAGCGDEEEEESIMDQVMKYLPGPLQDMLKK